MKKNIAKTLSLAAILGTMSVLPTNADEIISGKNPLNADTTIGAGESYRIEETGHVYDGTYHDYDKPSTADTTLTNNGTIINNGYTDTTGIDIANFINTGIVTSDNGSYGRLYIRNGGTNSGSISQNILQISEGTFTNDGTITVGTLCGDVTINRTAGNTSSLTIDDASYFNGSIDQGTLTINSHGKINITGNLTADTLNNNGEIIFKGNNSHTLKSSGSIGGSLIVDDFNYLHVESGKIEADAELTLKDGTNLWIQEDGDVTLNGNDTLAESTTINLKGGSLDITEYGENRNIIAENGKLTAKNLNVSGWSEIERLTDVTADNIVVNGGNLTIDDADNISTSVEMTSGSINYYITENPDFKFIANDGQLYLHDGSKLTLDGTNHIITDDVELTLNNFSQLTVVDGGSLNVGSNVTWNKYGEISLQGGSLSTNTTQNGTLKATSGNLTVAGEKLTIGSESSIAGDVTTTVRDGATLDINGGDVLINDNDNWNGTISLTGGTLTTNKSTANGILNATSGNLTVEGGQLTIGSGSSIAKDVVTTINNNSLLDIVNGGNVTLDESDNWVGGIILNGGNLTAESYSGTELDGKLEAVRGNLNVSSGTLTIKNDSYIYEDVATTVAEDAWLKIASNGHAQLNDNDNIKGVLQLDGGSVSTNYTTGTIGTLFGNSGNITVANGTLTLGQLSYISEDVETTVNSGTTLAINGGDVSLNDNDSIRGTVRLDDGYLYTDSSSALEYGKLEANSGNIVVSKLSLNNGSYVKDDVIVSAANGTIDILNGELNINSGDDIDGAKISLSTATGKFNYSNETNQNVELITSDGQVNLLKNSKMTLTDGSSVSSVLNIQEGAVLSLNQNTRLDINNKTTYDGIIENNGGMLSVNNFNSSSSTSSFTQNSGMTDIINSNITFNQGSISGGEINIFDNASSLNLQNMTVSTGNLSVYGGKLTVGNGSSIAEDVATILNSGAILDITGSGDVVLNDNDNIQGTVKLNGGSLTLNTSSSSGILEANEGVLNLSEVTLNNGSYIKEAVNLNAENGKVNIVNGEININDNDNINGATINLASQTGTFNYNSEQNKNIVLSAAKGNVNILGNSNLTLNSTSVVDATINLEENATLTMNSGSAIFLDNHDTYNGTIENKGGNLYADGFTNTSETAKFNQSAGMTLVYGGSNVAINRGSSISGGEIQVFDGSELNFRDANITGGNYTVDETSAFNYYGGSFNINRIEAINSNNIANVSFNMMNGVADTSTIGEMNLSGQANFSIDILSQGSSALSDQIKIGTLTGNGTLFINDWTLLGDLPTTDSILLGNILADGDGNPLLGDNISVTDKTVSGYKLVRNKTTGKYSLEFISAELPKFDSTLYRGQVSTIAQWQNQLAISDMLFNHSMLLPSFKDENGKMANKYAASEPLFAPYQYSKKDGGLWYKAYGTFEHLEMNHDLRVGNNAYGSLIGADFGVKDLKNGWQFMPTAYIGYNGAHQYYPGVSLYQNGGQAGFLGTWYKNDFIISSLTYGGVYDNHISVKGHSEDGFNYFAGTAAKAAYNWKFLKDFSLQPNLMVAYNYFGQQNWHSDFSQAGMMSGMLHGVNIAPGVNLIWEKETFSTYLTLQYMYNVNGAVDGKVGNTNIDNVEMERGYIQYGIGVTKKIGDRFSGYLQAVLRNVGRTGVGFQAGFSFKLGKK